MFHIFEGKNVSFSDALYSERQLKAVVDPPFFGFAMWRIFSTKVQ